MILGNVDVPMNYKSNTYRFRQDSNFLYFFGLDQQGLAGIIDLDQGGDLLFGNEASLDDIIWMGPQEALTVRASRAGADRSLPSAKLKEVLKEALAKGRRIHYLPPYRAENKLVLEELLGISLPEQQAGASTALIKAVVALRSVKEAAEILEIEKAMDVAYQMHTTAMKMARPGIYEREIAGVLEGIDLAHGGKLAFPLILSVRGETLHNHDHGNKLENGQLLLVDGGAETSMHYATDHTRTLPVGGGFEPRQRDIYEVVLNTQLEAIHAIKPGSTFKGIHLHAAEVLASGLKDLGLMKGDIAEAVALGAHALFMPHGLGHLMGLDVHDMEDLGEDYVGYDEEVRRSDTFGIASLRLGRRLQSGFVLTVEPGIYFIPALIGKWEQEDKFRDFIDYDRVKTFVGFGGIRLEDDILVTDEGFRMLGKPIPKTVEEIEKFMNQDNA